MTRLIQIEGTVFADNIVKTFEEVGVLKEEVENVLVWAIGDDFHRIMIRYWPHRLRTRLKLDVKDTDLVKDTVPKIAEKWLKDKEEG